MKAIKIKVFNYRFIRFIILLSFCNRKSKLPIILQIRLSFSPGFANFQDRILYIIYGSFLFRACRILDTVSVFFLSDIAGGTNTTTTLGAKLKVWIIISVNQIQQDNEKSRQGCMVRLDWNTSSIRHSTNLLPL